jgi:3'-phosphoadenosine 5'-phosphosulfate sulfotransferase (PAPS reductase)/FAD synthetase
MDKAVVEQPHTDKPVRHVLGLSGGKDSAALALFMRDRVPQMEYFFCDTGNELAETYEYIERLEAFLGKPVVRLNPERDFDHWLNIFGGYLPSQRMRWCTRMLKLKPFEHWVGDDPTFTYIAIRADEDRDGYISHKPNITAVYPFKEHSIGKQEVYRILDDYGLGLPTYYRWRTRSGCYFCFFQRKSEWVGLKENHPDLFELAKRYEKIDEENGIRYTWSERESLFELEHPERVAEIKRKFAESMKAAQRRAPSEKLFEIFSETLNEEDDEEPCLVCNL